MRLFKERRILEEFGETGLRRWGGILAEEWLPDLSGLKGRKIYREMADNDPTIGAILFAIKQICLTATFRVRPGRENQQAETFAAFVAENLQRLDPPLTPDFLSEALSFVVYGFAPFEICYTLDEGRIYWDGFRIRAQETVTRWEFDERGKLLGMYQRTQSGKEVFIPIEKLLLIKSGPERGSPEGRSLLRNAFVPYYMKKNIQLLEGIGVERDLCGLPVMYVPLNIFNDERKRAEIKQQLKNLRRDEEEGLILPFDYLEQREIFKLDLLGTRGSRQFSTGEIIARYNREIAQTLLADLVLVGAEARGSFALAREKRSLLELTVRGLLSIITTAISRQAIPRLIELNFGKVDYPDIPQLTFTLPRAPTISEIAELVSVLVKAGVKLDEPFVRMILEAAGFSEGAIRIQEGVLDLTPEELEEEKEEEEEEE